MTPDINTIFKNEELRKIVGLKEKKENIEGYCMNCEMIYRIRRSI